MVSNKNTASEHEGICVQIFTFLTVHFQSVSKYVFECLKKAHDSDYDSIAFPALGTGKLGYKKHKVAAAMFDAVERFAREHQDSCLTDVSFIIYPSDTSVYEAFKSACGQTVGKWIDI